MNTELKSRISQKTSIEDLYEVHSLFSTRTYKALKRNNFCTIADMIEFITTPYNKWSHIRFIGVNSIEEIEYVINLFKISHLDKALTKQDFVEETFFSSTVNNSKDDFIEKLNHFKKAYGHFPMFRLVQNFSRLKSEEKEALDLLFNSKLKAKDKLSNNSKSRNGKTCNETENSISNNLRFSTQWNQYSIFKKNMITIAEYNEIKNEEKLSISFSKFMIICASVKPYTKYVFRGQKTVKLLISNSICKRFDFNVAYKYLKLLLSEESLHIDKIPVLEFMYQCQCKYDRNYIGSIITILRVVLYKTFGIKIDINGDIVIGKQTKYNFLLS